MTTFIHEPCGLRQTDLNYLSSRLFRITLLALLLALAALALGASPVLAESPPSPNVLIDDYVSVPKNGSVDIEVSSNDTIPEFASFDFTNPENGGFKSFTTNAAKKIISFHYIPNEGFVGKDSFVYMIYDRQGGAPFATVHITVYSKLDCSTCLNRHAATPVNITVGGDGAFNYHFIGDGGVSTGPVLAPVKKLAAMYPSESGNIELYSGTNTFSGAPVVVSYLSAEKLVHVNTSYLDSHNGSMKPYIFVVNLDNEVSHWEW